MLAAILGASAQAAAPEAPAATRTAPAAQTTAAPATETAAAPGSGSGSAAGSNASNFGGGAQLSVNPRTGAVTLSSTLFKLPGIVSGMDAHLALTYRSDDAQNDIEQQISYFGLPYGWSLGLSYIYNDGEHLELHIDGQQSYTIDDQWQSSFMPAGATEPVTVYTGLKQYNRTDANFRTLAEAGQIDINGATAVYVFNTLGGHRQYFSAGGLLLRKEDRFGNRLDYLYSSMNGSPTDSGLTLTGIIDTWGNTITIGPCGGNNCYSGQIDVTLPDGRTVGWIPGGQNQIDYLIDTQGKITHIGWSESQCAHGGYLIDSMTTPSGGMTSLEWGCIQVCETAPGSGQSCAGGNTTTWPVVSTLYQCPNNASGEPCPAGSPNDDFETTTYAYQGADSANNYTGYPYYSPYEPKDPQADALMASNDRGFVYTTVTQTQSAGGATFNQVQTDYNFLHLKRERSIQVRARQASGDWGLSTSKVTSYCYPLLPDGTADSDCAMTSAEIDYQLLPANYQSPAAIGSCQYNVGADADPSTGRHSLVTMAYDSFGHTVNKRTYHSTASTGIGTCGARTANLSAEGMTLVNDQYMAYDTPATRNSDQYLSIGPGSGLYGLPTAQQSFIYLDPDDSPPGTHGTLTDTDGPMLVKLLCNTLTTDSGTETQGSNIKTSTVGLMDTSTSEPATLGVIDACSQTTPWTAAVAPPKTSTLSYDAHGRGIGHTSAWAGGYTAPDGVAATGHTTSYTLTTLDSGEAACGSGTDKTVLEITATALSDPGAGDAGAAGNVAQTHRICTLNGFHLSSTDPYDPTDSAAAQTTYFTHYADGLTQRTTHPNGSFVTQDYYYRCPTAQDGRSTTCPSGRTTAQTNCPYDGTANRNCVVHTLHAGDGNSSYVDGVLSVVVKDGLGRVVAHLDNTGAADTGGGYTETQSRATATYDSLGLVSARTSSIGATDPLTYATTVAYGPKLRPSLVCGPRGTAHQVVHDDVYQQTKTIINGHDKESYTLNDSRKLTKLVSCELSENTTASGSGACPTVAASTAGVDCTADGYYSYTLHDGSGVPHSVTASAGDQTDELASLQSVTGQSTITDGETTISAFSADLLQYGYSFSSTANQAGGAVTATSSWQRNLLGHKRKQQLSVTANAATTDVVSDLFAYNALADQQSETNRMSNAEVTLEKLFTYTPAGKMDSYTSYAGVTFQNYYDAMQRLVRHCYPGETSGSQGENITRDPITGKVLKIARFTNPNACSADPTGDQEGVWQTYAYNRFGGLTAMTYSDGAKLEWAYDAYQRPSCFADAMATNAGHSCPASPTAADFSPAASTMLIFHQYYADSDSYRRGKLQRSCRGVPDGSGGQVMKCLEFDYYTPTTFGGLCIDGEIANDGSCAKGTAAVTGAFPGMARTEAYYTGGPSDGGGTLVYRTTHSYDAHRRPAAVVTKNAAGKIILASTYAYDQYDNLTRETSLSQLDLTDTSNYQVTYGYDGLLRLISALREDLDGNLIRSLGYEYDAASNLTKKVEVTPDGDV